MAKRWFIDTTASDGQVVHAFQDVFFRKPTFGERLKFWSRTAQFQSNLRWKPSAAEDARVAAELVSGGLREFAQSSKHGGGSIIGTTIAMALDSENGVVQAQLWLAEYNTFFGINQQSDIIRSYAKQIAQKLRGGGASADVHK